MKKPVLKSKLIMALGFVLLSGLIPACGVKKQQQTQADILNSPPEVRAPEMPVDAPPDSSLNVVPMKKEEIIEKKITWLDYEMGYNKAVRENKIILVDVYTDWCGWCKVMDRETYTNAEVIKTINTHFVTVKLNPEKARSYAFGKSTMTAEQLHTWLGYGRTFGYPSTYFVHNPGTTQERQSIAGYLPPVEFLAILTQVINKK